MKNIILTLNRLTQRLITLWQSLTASKKDKFRLCRASQHYLEAHSILMDTTDVKFSLPLKGEQLEFNFEILEELLRGRGVAI